MKPIAVVPIEEIHAARTRIVGAALNTPLVRLNIEDAPAQIYLKLETMSPIRSFKLRPSGNSVGLVGAEQIRNGVWIASAGNWAQGVGWYAQQLGVACTVVVPDHAPQTKLDAMDRLGARYVKVPFDEWFEVMRSGNHPGMEGVYLSSESPAAVAGNGTIGLEIVEELSNVDAVIVPYGGGALSCGVASAIRALKPDTKLYACEVDTAAPLAASFAAGKPVAVDYIPTFIDGMGGPYVLEEMWPAVRKLLDGSLVVTVREVASAVKLLSERNCVVAEGAGAAPVAAAMAGKAGSGNVVCVVSGGNIDSEKLAKILQGEIP